jgi:acetyl-CoA carboxylase carboxyl transferase subunit alpha
LGGAHRNRDLMLQNLRNSIFKNLEYFKDLSADEIMNERKNKFLKIGRNKGFTSSSEDLKTLTIKDNNIVKILKLKKLPIIFSLIGIISLSLIIYLF